MDLPQGLALEIDCPHCSTANQLRCEATLECSKCQKPMSGFKYRKVKKAVSAAVVAFSLGVVGTVQVRHHFVPERYSIRSEYAIVDMCLNSSERPIAVSAYEDKRDDCVCALEQVQKTLKTKDFNEDRAHYLTTFAAAARQCKAARTSSSYPG